MKKCVDNANTQCFLPKAKCSPLCYETDANYPYNCKCKSSSFPENWVKCTKEPVTPPGTSKSASSAASSQKSSKTSGSGLNPDIGKKKPNLYSKHWHDFPPKLDPMIDYKTFNVKLKI